GSDRPRPQSRPRAPDLAPGHRRRRRGRADPRQRRRRCECGGLPDAARSLRAVHVPGLALRTLRRARHADAPGRVRRRPGPDDRPVCRHPDPCPRHTGPVGHRHGRRPPRGLPARSAPALDRHLRLPRPCPVAVGPRPQPLYERGRPDPRRPGEPVPRADLAQGAAGPVRAPAADGQSGPRRARLRRGDVGAQADRGGRGPRLGRTRLGRRAAARPRPPARRGARRAESAVAHVGRRRRTQRPADGLPVHGRGVPGGGGASAAGRRGARRRGRGQGHSGDRARGAPVRRRTPGARAPRRGRGERADRWAVVRGLRTGPAQRRPDAAGAGPGLLPSERPARPQPAPRQRVPIAGPTPPGHRHLRYLARRAARVGGTDAALDRRGRMDHPRPARHDHLAARLVHRRAPAARRAVGERPAEGRRGGHDGSDGSDSTHSV
ncbi:MAG: hypothetical protein AVDCRST_MAG17-474, partial [uncultured Solirubrobacterales bacterium]